MEDRICSQCSNEYICTEEPNNCIIHNQLLNMKCRVCGREFPESEMNHSGGKVNNVCKQCASIKSAETRAKRKAIREREEHLDKVERSDSLSKCYTNPELAKFSPRQLIEELKARGYHGKLYTTVEVHM